MSWRGAQHKGSTFGPEAKSTPPGHIAKASPAQGCLIARAASLEMRGGWHAWRVMSEGLALLLQHGRHRSEQERWRRAAGYLEPSRPASDSTRTLCHARCRLVWGSRRARRQWLCEVGVEIRREQKPWC